MEKEGFFEFGTIMKTRGLKGEVQIYFDGNKAANYENLEEIYIEINKKLVPHLILKSQFQKSVAFVYLEDIDNIDKASLLIKKRVFLPLEMLEEIQPEFDPKKLQGYSIIDNLLGPIGTITELLELPQQLVAICIYKGFEVLIPLNDHTIQEVKESEKIILMNIPDGLLEIYLNPEKNINKEEN